MKLKIMFLAFLVQAFSVSAQVRVEKDIHYAGTAAPSHSLNIYFQKDSTKQRDVIVFIHGGSWSSGKKETYWWLGRNFAKKGVVTAVINYPLAPAATYKEMAQASAQAVKWVKDHIAAYGGNPDRLFLMGHSAGGHLCELINADPRYFEDLGIKNPIKGVVLDDPFGLDMEEYLANAEKDHYYEDFIRTFSTDSKVWQAGSPLFYVKNSNNPHLILYGTKTYEAIKIQSERMNKLLLAQHVPATLKVIEGKKHVGMISQMIFGSNQLYKFILDFFKEVK
ncbi:alpha/beta hydrolase [Pedobacter sp. ASV12]|uniref:alpha/beta hydrolase n=1 Tax=Pedobacter sp. ASV12 TaxID=2795120 RepID=UPI0018EA5CBE|nr:alpha/beta hydrolase [Pedobacter sp. ASV12]